MKLLNKIKFITIIAAMIMAMASYATAAETFHDSLINGKISGDARIWYQTHDSDANRHIFAAENSTFDAGLRLSYVTDSYKGFKAAVGFFAVDDLGAYENIANNSQVGRVHGETKTYLGEANLSYQIANTSAKIGRMNIKSPLVNSDGWMIFPVNFEALLIKNTDIPDTTITAAYVTEQRGRNDEKFQDESFYNDGIAMIGAVNKSISNTTLTTYYYAGDDDNDTSALYLEANTKVGMFDLSSQYIRMKQDHSNLSNTNAFGAKVATKIGDIKVYAAYSYVGDGTLQAAKLSDGMAKTPLYTKTVSGDGDIVGRPDTDSVAICASTNVIEKLNVLARYAYHSANDSGNWSTGTNVSDGDMSTAELIAKYTGFEHITLWSAIWYSNHEGIGPYNGLNNTERITFRFKATYAF